jgi:hypothetical protein
MVDLARDLALLTADRLSGEGLRVRSVWAERGVRVVGYPTGILGQYAHDLTLDAIALRPLYRIMAPVSHQAIENRGTPSLDARVISLAGPLSPGYTGTPILTAGGETIGVAFGGI